MEKSPHFKPDQCALLLIDHQVGTIQLIKNITADQTIRNAVTLAKAALAFNMPIVMTSSQEDHVHCRRRRGAAETDPDDPWWITRDLWRAPGACRAEGRSMGANALPG
jgi:nicotinamidase-related amidase